MGPHSLRNIDPLIVRGNNQRNPFLSDYVFHMVGSGIFVKKGSYRKPPVAGGSVLQA